MATDQYATGYAFLDGQLLAESQKVSIEADPQHQVIRTMYKGFAGISKGAASAKASVSNAVPKAGPEYDYITVCQDGTPIEFIAWLANKRFSSKGFMMNVKGDFGEGEPATFSFDFEGEPWTVE